MTQQKPKKKAKAEADEEIAVTVDHARAYTPDTLIGTSLDPKGKGLFTFAPASFLQKREFQRALKAERIYRHGIADRYRRCRVIAESVEGTTEDMARVIEVLDGMEAWLTQVQEFTMREAIGDKISEDELPILPKDIQRDYGTIIAQYERFDPVLQQMDDDDERFEGEGIFMAVRYARPDWEGLDVERVCLDAALTHDCVEALATRIGDVAFQELGQYCLGHLRLSAVAEKK